MRFFTVIPATLLAVSSFVSAIPAAVSAVSARDDSSVQALINALDAANTKLSGLNQQLATEVKTSPQDSSAIDAAVMQIKGIMSDMKMSADNTDYAAMTPSEATELNKVSMGTFDSVDGIVAELVYYLDYVLDNLDPEVVILLNNTLILVEEIVDSLQQEVPGGVGSILAPVINILENILSILSPVLLSLGL